MAGANDSAEAAEAGVEAVVHPSAVLLERVGVHLGQSARSAEAAAQHAIDGSAGIRPAGLDPGRTLQNPPAEARRDSRRTSSTPSRRRRRHPSLDIVNRPLRCARECPRTHGAEAEVLVDIASGITGLVHGVRHVARGCGAGALARESANPPYKTLPTLEISAPRQTECRD